MHYNDKAMEKNYFIEKIKKYNDLMDMHDASEFISYSDCYEEAQQVYIDNTNIEVLGMEEKEKEQIIGDAMDYLYSIDSVDFVSNFAVNLENQFFKVYEESLKQRALGYKAIFDDNVKIIKSKKDYREIGPTKKEEENLHLIRSCYKKYYAMKNTVKELEKQWKKLDNTEKIDYILKRAVIDGQNEIPLDDITKLSQKEVEKEEYLDNERRKSFINLLGKKNIFKKVDEDVVVPPEVDTKYVFEVKKKAR